jgi:hypothetical protein
MCSLVFILVLLIAFAAEPSGPMSRSSLKKRIALTDDTVASAASSFPEPELAPERMGGIKKRLAADQPGSESRPQKASGGIRRRLDAASSSASLEGDGDAKPFNAELRKMWAKGELKSSQVQRLAKTASEQHALGLGKLAKDSNPKHACRDLQRALGWPTGCPDFEWVNLPSPHDEPGGFMHPHPIICPITLLEKSFQRDEAHFQRFFAGDPAENVNFWYNMRHHVTYKRIEQYVDPQNTSPMSVHGDGAPTNKTDGLFTIQWSIDTVEGTTLEKANIYTVVQKQFLRGGMLEMLFSRLAWSFNCLLTGVIQEYDWRGRLHP